MAEQSYLIQSTANQVLDLFMQESDVEDKVIRENTYSKKLGVSRTTIRKVFSELEDKGIIGLVEGKRRLQRPPQPRDYFDTSDQVSTREEVVEKFFLDKINNGSLQPGQKFSELEIAKESECNTITVREFLIRFSRFGLIDKKPRAKWEMIKFDEKFATELIEFRRILEMSSITRLLATPRTEPVWHELEALLQRHNEVLKDLENRLHEFNELDRELHMIIQQSSDNRFFSQFFDVVSLICHYHYQWDKHDEFERHSTALKEHIEILTNLLANNAPGVISALETHLNTAKMTLLGSVCGLDEMCLDRAV